MNSKYARLLIAIVFFILVLSLIKAAANDNDNDGMPNIWENYYGLDENNSADAPLDLDSDALNNLAEYLNKTSPIVIDTDNDGYTDKEEVIYGSNANSSASYPHYSLNHVLLISPQFGVSKTDVFSLQVRTSNASSLCKFSENPAIIFSEIQSSGNIFSPSPDGYVHTINNFDLSNLPENFVRKIYVICNTSGGYINDEFPENVTLSVDKTPPVIFSSVVDPDFVTERLEVNMRAETDDQSICHFDEGNVSYLNMKYNFDNAATLIFAKNNTVKLTFETYPKVEDAKSYQYFFACMNKAGSYSSTGKVNFSVNLSATNQIIMQAPSGYVSAGQVKLEIKTNKDSTCYYGQQLDNSLPPDHAKYHSLSLPNVNEGTHAYRILCNFDLGGPGAEIVISFTVDRTKPSAVDIASELEICPGRPISATFSAQDTIGIAGYYYRILDYLGVAMTNFTFSQTPNVTVSSHSFEENSDYYIEVYAADIANNTGVTQKSTSISVLPIADELCAANDLPYLGVDAMLTENGMEVNLACRDDDGWCNTSYFIIDSNTNPGCGECGLCSYNKYFSSLTLNENTTLCYHLEDNKNGVVDYSANFRFSSCTTGDSCCNGRQGVYCREENCTAVTVECNLENIDSDNDTIPDIKETECGLDPQTTSDAQADNDDDGLTNKEECMVYKTDISNSDSDGDGFSDRDEVDQSTDPNNKDDFPIDENKDSDDDSIPDAKETKCGLDPFKADANLDNDKDGLTNKEECTRYNTNANKADTDGDGYSDYAEIKKETDPLNKKEFPKSNTLNILLFAAGLLFALGGIIVIFTGKPSKKEPAYGAERPMVDFREAKQELMQQAAVQRPAEQIQRAPIKRDIPKSDSLDAEIHKQRELLRMKKITNVFDEFASEKKPEQAEKIGKTQQQDQRISERLDALDKRDAFEELEVLGKKEEKKLKREETDENDKLDKLAKKKKNAQ